VGIDDHGFTFARVASPGKPKTVGRSQPALLRRQRILAATRSRHRRDARLEKPADRRRQSRQQPAGSAIPSPRRATGPRSTLALAEASLRISRRPDTATKPKSIIASAPITGGGTTLMSGHHREKPEQCEIAAM